MKPHNPLHFFVFSLNPFLSILINSSIAPLISGFKIGSNASNGPPAVSIIWWIVSITNAFFLCAVKMLYCFNVFHTYFNN